ncbi:MAG: cysteine--tRNA ligase [Nitrospirae bacterium]|nr:cysteine--tRNA ligase [Nitrospirota bacterium]
MKLYNTFTGNKEPFVPLRPGEVRMYVCGVTVYDDCHIGHARSAVVFDVFRRYLTARGYRVTYVRNFTDIDDKIIRRAQAEGVPAEAIAERYIAAYYRDMDRLGVQRADVEPRATEHLAEMQTIISGLLARGYAYAAGGDVLFRVKKFSTYGSLSKRSAEDLSAGARVEVSPHKEDPMDFVLWKTSKPGEPAWDSPWGPGRPGWHIECSAMAMKHLGETFDIHGGGMDLIFPHHENEIAQSEALTGRPFVRCWMHNGFVNIDREKMSKSLGNFFTVAEVLERYDPEAVRLFLLSTHYRSPVDYSDRNFEEARAGLDRVYTLLREFKGMRGRDEGAAPMAIGEREAAVDEALRQFQMDFREALDDDFNTAAALGQCFDLVRHLNREIAACRAADQRLPDRAIARAQAVFQEAGRLLGLFQQDPEAWFKKEAVASRTEATTALLSPEEIETRIRDRAEARGRKDWATADAIRRALEAQGVVLEDKAGGATEWKRVTPLTGDPPRRA